MHGRYHAADPEGYPQAVYFLEATLSDVDAVPTFGEDAAVIVEATQHPSTASTGEHPVQEQTPEGDQRLYVAPAKPDLLPGRETSATLLTRARQYFTRYNRGEALPHKLGVLWFDLDDFKEMQDRHPRKHAAGDDMIRLALETARRAIRSEDVPPKVQNREKAPIENRDEIQRLRVIMQDAILARRYELTGDEFIVLVEVDAQEDLEKIGHRIKAALANVRDEDLAPNGFKSSFGAKIHEKETSAPALLGAADVQLFRNKMMTAYETGYAGRPPVDRILFDLTGFILNRLGISGRHHDKIVAAIELVRSGVLPRPEQSTEPQRQDDLEQAAFFAAVGRELLQQFPLLLGELGGNVDDDSHDVRST